MCDICLQDPCNQNCPNHESKTIARCKICFDNICDDECYAIIDGDCYHIDCIEDSLTLVEILRMCGCHVFPLD